MPNPTKTRPCVARVHLRGADFAVYDAAMALTARSNGLRILSASRWTLSEMTGYSPRTVGLSRIRLVKKGWFKPRTANWKDDQQRTGASGKFRTPEFEIVEHDTWAASNPGKCQTGYISTERGMTEHGNNANGATEHATKTETVSGPTTDTVSGRTVSKALSLCPKEKPTKNSAAKTAVFVVPDWVPKKEWDDWVEMRRSMRKSPTKKALELAVRKLDELRGQGHDSKKILENSILNGWAGLFPLKNEGRNQNEPDGEEDDNLKTLRRIRPPDWEPPKIKRAS